MPGDLTTHIITASAQKGRDCTLLSDKPAAALLHALSKKFDFNYQKEYYPWPVFHCANTMLLPLLTDLRFFEYFVFDESMNCVLFDTHHNELLFCCR
jgi:hypothetical protein